jgi:FkbM family methyltransferase
MEELMIMRDAMNGVTEPVLLDIGANVGHHSLFASTIACQVHSFEPFHIVFNKLNEKIEFNKIKNITLHEIGLGEINEEIPFTPPINCNLGTGSFTNTNAAPSTLILPIRNGDEYLIPLNLEKIDFIKWISKVLNLKHSMALKKL